MNTPPAPRPRGLWSCTTCRRATLAALALALGTLVAVPVATQPAGSGRGVSVPQRPAVAKPPVAPPAALATAPPVAMPTAPPVTPPVIPPAPAPTDTATALPAPATTPATTPAPLAGHATPPAATSATPAGATAPVPPSASSAAPAAPGAPGVPTAATPAPQAPAGAAASPPPARASVSSPPVIEFAPASLPVARVGQRYGPLPLVRHDGTPVVFDVDGDLAPSGLNVNADGVLGGEATRPGRYRFALTLVGAPGVSAPLRQTFTLRVEPPVSAAGTRAAAPPGPPPVQVPRDVLDRLPTLTEGRVVRTWKLGLADVERLGTAAVEAAAAQEAEAQRGAGWEPVPGAEPSPAAVAAGARRQQQLQAALANMLEVEYASASQFRSALAEQGRAACRKLVEAAVAAAQRRDPSPAELAACDTPTAAASTTPQAAARPTPAAVAATAPAAGDLLTPQQAREELLPTDLQQTVTALAARRHTLADARPVRWTGGGCGCVLVERESMVYGLLPFWHAGTDEQPLQVDFSAYERIGYLGALLADDGGVRRAPGLHDEHPDGLVRALRHGTALDLVVHRSDWAPLLALQGQPRQAVLRRAAEELNGIVQTPLSAWWRDGVRHALPGWPQATHLYSGLTLYFDDLPAGDAAQRWMADLVQELVPRLEAAQRGLTLQVVVKGAMLGSDDGIALAVRLLELTGSIRAAGDAGTGQGARQALKPRVPTRLLVLLDEPTTDTKKALRAALDGSPELKGHQRVDFLNAILPMMAHPAGDAPARMSSGQAFQFDADLAYYGWQYGGAGLWPVADAGRGAGAQVTELLHRSYRNGERLWTERWTLTHRLCTVVCPYRTGWRLLLHGLLVLGGVSLAAFALSCRVRAIGLPMVIWMWGGLAVTGLVFWLLLTCDPALHALSESNAPLVALFSAGLLGALWLMVQRRVPAP